MPKTTQKERKMRKNYLLIAIVLISALVLGACQKQTVDTPEVESAGTLRIWADEQRAPVFNQLAAKFKEAHNVDLVVENIAGIRDQFLVAAPAGEGPDIIIIPHDQLPQLTESGLIAEMNLGAKAADFSEQALKAFTVGGKLYGMPYATENLGFFYNKDYVTEVPTTWQGVYDLSKQLIDEGKIKYGIVLAGTN